MSAQPLKIPLVCLKVLHFPVLILLTLPTANQLNLFFPSPLVVFTPNHKNITIRKPAQCKVIKMSMFQSYSDQCFEIFKSYNKNESNKNKIRLSTQINSATIVKISFDLNIRCQIIFWNRSFFIIFINVILIFFERNGKTPQNIHLPLQLFLFC